MSVTEHPSAPFGRHFLIGLRPSHDLVEDDKRLLSALRPAGVILFGANFRRDCDYSDWLGSLRTLVDDVRNCCSRQEVLICMDHEGTGIARPPEPVTAFAHARHWATQAEAVGNAMATELASLGINVNFAPVLDIDSIDESPVIGLRAFGTSPESVISAGLPFIRALERSGVLACPKHFPGHGAAAVDSHAELPAIDINIEKLRERELLPFRAAVDAGVKLLMTGHLNFPRIDRKPATFSTVLGDLLRGELGFEGVVVTDDIGMPAMQEHFGSDDAVVDALIAGTDMIMICDYWTDTDRALGLARQIEEAVKSGRIPSRVITSSRSRIESLLQEVPVNPVTPLAPERFAEHQRVAPLGKRSAGLARETQTVKLVD